jgi:hypothetical protein
MTQTPADTRPPQEPPYEHAVTQSKKFLDALADVPWQSYPAYNIIVLEADCPVCDHKNAISKVVPTVGALPFRATYAAGTGQASTYVECKCAENHGAPPGEKGCGRWAMIVPHLADPSALDESAAEKGTGDDGSH